MNDTGMNHGENEYKHPYAERGGGGGGGGGWGGEGVSVTGEGTNWNRRQTRIHAHIQCSRYKTYLEMSRGSAEMGWYLSVGSWRG